MHGWLFNYIPSLRKITREGRHVLTYVKQFRRRGREFEKWKSGKSITRKCDVKSILFTPVVSLLGIGV